MGDTAEENMPPKSRTFTCADNFYMRRETIACGIKVTDPRTKDCEFRLEVKAVPQDAKVEIVFPMERENLEELHSWLAQVLGRPQTVEDIVAAAMKPLVPLDPVPRKAE